MTFPKWDLANQYSILTSNSFLLLAYLRVHGKLLYVEIVELI